MPQKQQRPIRGLLIIGGDGTGKTTLLQRSVLRLISDDAELGVVYVGEEDSCLSLRALIDPCYLLSDAAPPEDAARRGGVKTVVIPRDPAARADAWDQLGRALDRARASAGAERLAVALDDVGRFLPSYESKVLTRKLSRAAAADPDLRVLATFTSFAELTAGFREEGAGLLLRVEGKVLLRNSGDERADAILHALTGRRAHQLEVGEAVFISHRLDTFSAVAPAATLHHLAEQSVASHPARPRQL
jgi:hypothetical protein